jgi:hypothetical protein
MKQITTSLFLIIMSICIADGHNVNSISPVVLSYFIAFQTTNDVVITWRTIREDTNLGFDIQKSDNGTDWESIYFVIGSGTSSDVHDYKYVDSSTVSGTTYYRLEQIDMFGNFDFSPVVVVNITYNDVSNLIGVSTVESTIKLTGGERVAHILNIEGNHIKTVHLIKYDMITIDVSNFTSGMYFITTKNNKTIKFIKK